MKRKNIGSTFSVEPPFLKRSYISRMMGLLSGPTCKASTVIPLVNTSLLFSITKPHSPPRSQVHVRANLHFLAGHPNRWEETTKAFLFSFFSLLRQHNCCGCNRETFPLHQGVSRWTVKLWERQTLKAGKFLPEQKQKHKLSAVNIHTTRKRCRASSTPRYWASHRKHHMACGRHDMPYLCKSFHNVTGVDDSLQIRKHPFSNPHQIRGPCAVCQHGKRPFGLTKLNISSVYCSNAMKKG